VRGGAPYPGSPGDPGSSVPAPPSPSVEFIAAAAGVDDDEAKRILDEIRRRHRPEKLGAYVRAMTPGDIAEHRDELRASVAEKPPKPPWCGICDERTRQRQHEDGDRIRVGRCPDCHPLAKRSDP